MADSYEQEHIYTYKYFKLLFGCFLEIIIKVLTKKRPNDNLEYLHVYSYKLLFPLLLLALHNTFDSTLLGHALF